MVLQIKSKILPAILMWKCENVKMWKCENE
jgi:hypothetical protein